MTFEYPSSDNLALAQFDRPDITKSMDGATPKEDPGMKAQQVAAMKPAPNAAAAGKVKLPAPTGTAGPEEVTRPEKIVKAMTAEENAATEKAIQGCKECKTHKATYTTKKTAFRAHEDSKGGADSAYWSKLNGLHEDLTAAGKAWNDHEATHLPGKGKVEKSEPLEFSYPIMAEDKCLLEVHKADIAGEAIEKKEGYVSSRPSLRRPEI